MKITIEQALKQGIASYNEGNLKDAERFYRAILKSQPSHPDANHNLGVLAVSVNKVFEAIPLFKNAIKSNPNIEQFWISYINALIKEQLYDNAKQAIKEARLQGIDEKKLNVLKERLINKNEKNNISSLSPSEKKLKNLLGHYQAGRLDKAKKMAKSIAKKYPSHPFSWKILGAILKQSGRIAESLIAIQNYVKLAPQDSKAHLNLGNTLKDLGRFEEAEASFRQSISLNRDFPVTHSNLGNILFELGKFKDAEISYKQAITLKPDFAQAYGNLGVVFEKMGRFKEAEASTKKAISLKPDYYQAYNNLGSSLKKMGKINESLESFIIAIKLKPDFIEAKVNLSEAISNFKFNSSYHELYPILMDILTTGNFIRPTNIVNSILSLLSHDPLIKELLSKENNLMSLNDAELAIRSLDKITLINHLMRICPFPDLQFEELFVTIRSLLLLNLDEIEVSRELINFLSSLALHCSTNEYVYFESDKETRLIEGLESKIKKIIVKSKQPEVIEVLLLASYRSLHLYDWCQNLEAINHLEEVRSRLIDEPYKERLIALEIPLLTEISDDISYKVKEQYEENPYPRWVRPSIPLKTKSIYEVCNDVNLDLYSKSIKNISDPAILIAGCGTGQHSIETASRFSNCKVTAVDLSSSSLAYAQRKTNELGIRNLDYLQADILDLHKLKRKFDIIESVGVLHHMDNPIKGWKVLTELLKPNGLMKIGLYSELARNHIVKTRQKIVSLGIGVSSDEIREFRQFLKVSNNKDYDQFTDMSDFFSLSEFRDLVFHVQEHRFTILKIQDHLNQLGLKFCGFENADIDSFKRFHGNGSNIFDLKLWHQFEQNKSDTFISMYQFWCQNG